MKTTAPYPINVDTIGANSVHGNAHYVLQLFTIGTTSHSIRAISNIRKICEEHLAGRYELVIVDVSQHPMLAKCEQIIAAPTLIKRLPLPLRRFIGDMSQTNRILLGLNLGETAEKLSHQQMAEPPCTQDS